MRLVFTTLAPERGQGKGLTASLPGAVLILSFILAALCPVGLSAMPASPEGDGAALPVGHVRIGPLYYVSCGSLLQSHGGAPALAGGRALMAGGVTAAAGECGEPRWSIKATLGPSSAGVFPVDVELRRGERCWILAETKGSVKAQIVVFVLDSGMHLVALGWSPPGAAVRFPFTARRPGRCYVMILTGPGSCPVRVRAALHERGSAAGLRPPIYPLEPDVVLLQLGGLRDSTSPMQQVVLLREEDRREYRIFILERRPRCSEPIYRRGRVDGKLVRRHGKLFAALLGLPQPSEGAIIPKFGDMSIGMGEGPFIWWNPPVPGCAPTHDPAEVQESQTRLFFSCVDAILSLTVFAVEEIDAKEYEEALRKARESLAGPSI